MRRSLGRRGESGIELLIQLFFSIIGIIVLCLLMTWLVGTKNVPMSALPGKTVTEIDEGHYTTIIYFEDGTWMKIYADDGMYISTGVKE